MSRLTRERLQSLTVREHFDLFYYGYYQAARRYGKKSIAGSCLQALRLYIRTWREAGRASKSLTFPRRF